MAANARGSAAHTATRRRAYQDGALRPEWQCPPHGTARSGPSGSAAHTATRRRTYRNGASRAEWQCRPRGAARSGPSGSATHTATRRRTYGLHAPALPLDVERTETVRSGPSGGAGSGGLRASSRCADARTHLQDVSRASGSWALFETDPLRAVERLLARQVGMAVQLASPM